MVLEPNCCIIAACLPTFRPLWANGRGAESIIRSVRSILSLRSLRGNSSESNGSRPSRRDYIQNRMPDFPKNNGFAESQIELQTIQKISNHGEQEVIVSGQQPYLPEISSINRENNRIYVTNGVIVERG